MGNGRDVDVADARVHQPRGERRGHARAHDARLVAANDVERQRRRACVRLADLAIRHQPQLDERLEAVADAAHQPVASLEQLHHALADGGVAEEGGDELAGAVRLVAAGETAGNKDDLRLLKALRERLHGFLHVFGREVAHHDGFRFRPGRLEGALGVVLAVRAGEHGDKHARAGDLHGSLRRSVALEAEGLDLLLALRGAHGEHILQLRVVDAFQSLAVHALAAISQRVVLRRPAQQMFGLRALGVFDHEAAVAALEQVFRALVKGEADAVAQTHLEHGFSRAAHAQRLRGDDLALANSLCHMVKQRAQALGHGQAVLAVLGQKQPHVRAGALELVGNDVFRAAGGHGEGDQRRRHVHLLERAAHGVLAADGRRLEVELRHQRAEQRRHGPAPLLRLAGHALEVLLEGQVRPAPARAAGHQLGHGRDYGQVRARVGALFHYKGVEAVGHHRGGSALRAAHGQQRGHRLRRGQLPLAAEGHQQAHRPVRGIEALAQAAAGTHVEVARHRPQPVCKRRFFFRKRLLRLHQRRRLLGRAVGIEELAGDVDDDAPVPAHHQPLFLRDFGHHRGFEVFLVRQRHERIHIFGCEYHGHALLRFGNGQLGAVEAVVLARHGV